MSPIQPYELLTPLPTHADRVKPSQTFGTYVVTPPKADAVRLTWPLRIAAGAAALVLLPFHLLDIATRRRP